MNIHYLPLNKKKCPAILADILLSSDTGKQILLLEPRFLPVLPEVAE